MKRVFNYIFNGAFIHNIIDFIMKSKTSSDSCIMCDNPEYGWFDVMKYFCSNIDDVMENLCLEHVDKMRKQIKVEMDKE